MLLLFSGYFQRNASCSGAARGCICSFADVLKFADGPVLAPVGAGVPDGPFVFPPCHQQGVFRALGRGSLLAAAPKVTKTLLETAGFKTSCAVGVRQKTVAAYPAKTQMLHIVVQRIAYDPLIAAAPAFRAVVRCSVAAQRRFLRCFVVFYIVCNASAGRSGAGRGYICSSADVLKFADGPAPAPVGAGVPGSPHRRTAKYRRTFA